MSLVPLKHFCLFQGITLKMNDLNHCIVARIMHGGMIHRQGTHPHVHGNATQAYLPGIFSQIEQDIKSFRVIMNFCFVVVVVVFLSITC